MNTYLTLFGDKNAQLNGLISSGVDQGFINVYTNVLNVSKAVAEGGDVDSAIALLNGLDASNAPGSTHAYYILPNNRSYSCSSCIICGLIPKNPQQSQLLHTRR